MYGPVWHCNYNNVLSVYFYSYAVITVSANLTAVTVQESDLMALIELCFDLPFVPITITYVTTDGTATGIDWILINYGL